MDLTVFQNNLSAVKLQTPKRVEKMREGSKAEAEFSETPNRKRVAAYARVSVDSKHLRNSLSAQKSYYSEYIRKNPQWIYAGVYADDYVIIGISLKKPIKPMFFSNPNLQNFLTEWNSMYKAYIRQANQELNIQSTIAW